MREIQIAVMLRLAMTISVSERRLSLECTFKSQPSAVWLKEAAKEAYSVPSEFKRVPSQGGSYAFAVSFNGVDAKKLLLFSRLLDVKTKKIAPAFPSFIDVSSIPVAKTVWRGAFMARGELNPEKKSGAKIYCPFPDLLAQLEDAAGALGLEAQINIRGRKKSVEVPPAEQTVKLLNLIGAGECAKTIRASYERKSEEGAKHVVAQLYEANRKRSSEAAGKACERIRNAFKILEGSKIKPELREAGELRLKYPNATLSELGALASPPISKDAVAGRMRRLYRQAAEAKNSAPAPKANQQFGAF